MVYCNQIKLQRTNAMYTIHKIENLSYSADPACKVDLWLPEGVADAPVFLYFHGGGLESGCRWGIPLADLVAKFGIAVATADYRMYPTAKFPDYLIDAAACTRFLLDQDIYPVTADRLYLGGSSAGGYISMMLCFDSRYLAEVGLKPTDIAGYIHDAGQPTTHFNVLRERGLDTRLIRADEAAPVYFIDHTPQPEDVPPMLFIYDTKDMPCRPEQTEMLLATMRYFGYPMEKIQLKIFEGYGHCGYHNKQNENGEELLSAATAEFIRSL